MSCANSSDGFVSLDRLVDSTPRAIPRQPRDASRRQLYLDLALASIPRILGAMDRNPFQQTYGCLDRGFAHYRTSDFPSQMYQEALWPLALVYTHEMPGNRWYRHERIRDLVIAALRYCANSSRPDGSCDDYYPWECALGSAVFATNAAASAYLLLSLDDPQLRSWFDTRATWIAQHHESGRLSNHQALAALALARCGRITDRKEHFEAARDKVGLTLAWQSSEGWFNEYDGADPGYQTVTLDALVQYRNLTDATWLNPAIHRGLAFARNFLHADSSFGGEYGSRGTYHFYPHGMELLARDSADAADLADGYLHSVACGRQASFSDDRMYAHYVGNLVEAWLDWSPQRPARDADNQRTQNFAAAKIYVRGDANHTTVVSAARGGVFKRCDLNGCTASDAGLIVEFEDGRLAVSQRQDLGRPVTTTQSEADDAIEVDAQLHWCRSETFTPVRFLLFRLLLLVVRTRGHRLVRRALQRRVIQGRKAAPIVLKRRFEFQHGHESGLTVVDTIRLTSRNARVRRMSFGTDHQTGYTAASGVYLDSTLLSWTDLSDRVAELNDDGQIVIRREFTNQCSPSLATSF